MSAIDELLAMTDEEEAWEVIPRYEVNAMYADDDGPIEVNNKSIGDMSSQISIQGESMSQYVEFMMSRYYDNIDLSEKVLSIHYRLGERVGDNAPVNVYKSQDRIKFGWLIPANATADEGKLAISIWARSLTDTEEYIWKSRTTHYTIERGMTIGEGITEPDENWYLDFVRQMDTKVSEALLYSNRAKQSANEASESAQSASVSKQEASNSATTAIQKAGEALTSASQASKSATTAISNAELSETYRDGAKDYYERTKGISEGLSGQLVPMGTVAFEDLPPLSEVVIGWMYNISNEFTTTSDFKEGAGRVIPLGSNVYKTTDGYWDVLAGSPVSGIKGSAETVYRSGNVNITPKNLGITVVNNTKDEDKNVKYATKANQDNNGNVIHDTYATKAENKETVVSNTITGKNVTATDSTDAPIISLKEKGYTEQFTTTGKNKLNITANNLTAYGITLTVNNDKSITINGTATQDFITKIGEFNDKDDSYILTGCPSGGSTSTYYLVASCRDENNIWKADNVDVGSGKTLSNDYAKRIIQIGVKSGKTVSNLTFYPMIRLASISDTTYEPYTGGVASPNPDYPQEIVGLDKVSVKTTGKNIFGGLALAQALVDSGSSSVVLDVDAKIVQYGYNNNSSSTKALFNNFKENTQYTIILKTKCTKIGTVVKFTSNLVINYTDGTRKMLTDIVNSQLDTVVVAVITTDASKSVSNIKYVYQDGSTTVLYYDECGIFEGVVTADDFEPYTETLAEIDLTEPLYEGDYIEYRADGTGVLHRKMASFVFDGEEDVRRMSFGANNYVAVTPKVKAKKNNINTYSNYYKTVDVYDLNNVPENGILVNHNGDIVLKDERYATLEEYKSWLQSNPVTVVYELATPQEIELTAEQLAQFKNLRTFEPITNIISNGETEVQYFTNSESGKVLGMIQRQLASLS